MTSCVHGNTQGSYGLCQEWVASLPANQEALEPVKVSQTNDSIIAGSGLVTRRHGVLGLPHSGKYNASDIFQLAQAARKARERLSVVASSTVNETPACDNERAVMLRSAFAAQRLDRYPPSEGTQSLDSSYDPFGLLDEDECFPTAEELLLELGFGGPAQGIDRVPERFLQPSQMHGVELDKFFARQQELEEARETGSLGYRGLVGPPSRRPSTIVARLMERMLQKSLPTASSSFDCPPKEESREEEKEDTVTLNSQLMTVPVADSRKTSPASSRRSSLRRQDCIDLQELHDEVHDRQSNNSQSVSEDDHEEEKQDTEENEKLSNKACSGVGAAFLPTVYVTPPPSTVISRSTANSSGHEVDSIIACLQLAAEVYRVQLDCQRSDENHNTSDLKQDLRREIEKTDCLLQKLRERLLNARSSHEPVDAGSLRPVVDDMIELLQQQQRLYHQAMGLAAGEDDEGSFESETGEDEVEESRPVRLPASWVRSFERRMSAAVTRSVRRELFRAGKSRPVK